ncbi:HEXXH motif domain-containing protein [Actinoplanes sp. NPDC026619]|uniref:HEXXH motif domain-containing protein n=1 Tax=Actinoplanes sp. NPDC026619 TaxID=3155798 RepID=UPI0033E865BD
MKLADLAPARLDPLPPVDDAWQALERAQSGDPQAFRSVVMDPQIGNWAAYVVRMHLAGTSQDPPWVTFGQLHAVALVAASRAGRTWRTRVPLRDGHATLPGLGQARFDGARRWEFADAETAAGQIRIRRRNTTVTVPGDPRNDVPGWRGLRTLTAGHDPVLQVSMQDLDPFRNLADPIGPERLTDDEVAHWQSMLDQAWDLLCRDDSATARALAMTVSSLTPLARADHVDEYEIRSASSGEAFGAMVLSSPHDSVDLAATLVHEYQHIKLGCLMHLLPLHRGEGRSNLYAPWRDDPRPLGGLLQGVYAFRGIAAFYRNRARSARGMDRRAALYTYALTRGQTAEGLAVARASGDLTDLGEEFLDGLAATMRPWFDDEIPADIRRLAGLAAQAHRVTWLLRHRHPAPESVAAVRDAWTAGAPFDEIATRAASVQPTTVTPKRSRIWSTPLRQAVKAPPPANTPETALIAGDAEGAKKGFLPRIESDPADMVAWAGLAMAYNEAGPAGSGYALASRPDLIAAVYRELRAGGAAPGPDALAEWACHRE